MITLNMQIMITLNWIPRIAIYLTVKSLSCREQEQLVLIYTVVRSIRNNNHTLPSKPNYLHKNSEFKSCWVLQKTKQKLIIGEFYDVQTTTGESPKRPIH